MFVLLTTHHESDDNQVESVLPPKSLTFLSPPNTKTTEPWYVCE